jgi:hypothetical protein
MFHRVLMVCTLVLAVSATECLAQGTPQEQAACRPDVRKFCRDVKSDGGSDAFLACLKANLTKLSKACRDVLQSRGK